MINVIKSFVGDLSFPINALTKTVQLYLSEKEKIARSTESTQVFICEDIQRTRRKEGVEVREHRDKYRR